MNNISAGELTALLHEALNQKGRRAELVRSFQTSVWNSSRPGDEDPVWRILRDLAFDLDFYEADSTRRSQSSTYYGDARLEREIDWALRKLRRLGIPDS
jgi:hypothetical protein